MKKKKNLLCFSLLALLPLVTSCGNGVKIPADWDKFLSFEQTGQTAYNKFKDVKRKGKYVTYETYLPETLNSAVTMQAENSRYIANIVDGLVDVDRTGAIIPALATSYSWNTDNTELTLKIRDGVKWVKNQGTGSDVYMVEGKEAMVTANDWVTGAKYVLDAASGSESSYLMTMFIEGAEEYNVYTQFKFYQQQGYGIISQAKIDETAKTDGESSDEKVKNAWTTCSRNVGRVASPSSTCGKYIDTSLINDQLIAGALEVTVDDLPNIANFSRVGVKASQDGKTLTYKLMDTAPYFLTVLTYTPYFPIYAPFVEAIGGIDAYGMSKDKVLSCGAYVMNNFKMGTGKSLDFVRNDNYWDIKNVYNYHVRVLTVPKNSTDSTMRQAYESGTVSGFTVNPRDSSGWEKYVLGGKNGTGTLENPAHPDAHAVEGSGDGSTFGFMLNLNRDATKAGNVNTLMGTESEFDRWNEAGENIEVLNTNRALSNSPALRELVLKSLDTHQYSESLGADDYSKSKYMVNTWVPANFITYEDYDPTVDNAQGIMGNDFVDFTKKAFIDKFYDGDYSEANFEKANKALGYSQHSTGEHALSFDTTRPDATKWSFTLSEEGQKQLDDLKVKAKAEIDAYNAAHTDTPITTPVMIEMSGLYYNSEENESSGNWINTSNYRVNGCWIDDGKYDSNFGKPDKVNVCTKEQADSALFRIIKNKSSNIPDSNAYQVLSAYNRMSLVISGWGPDYSDPLTFANCLVSDGDLASNVGNTKSIDNPNHEAIASQWETYDRLVSEASAILDQKARLQKFAEAEIELLYNLHVVRPLYMIGLGKNVVVSKIVPFRTSKAIYGVSNEKYKYIEILDRTITQEEYAALKAERSVQNSTNDHFE